MCIRDRDITDWNVSNVNNMFGMFQNASEFNQDISGWYVKNVTTMQNMFNGATKFNQNIRYWETREDGTTFTNMFKNASAMITTYGPDGQNITQFGTSPNYTPTKDFFNYTPPQFKNNGGAAGKQADDIHYAVSEASENDWNYQGQHISEWDVSQVQNMNSLFKDKEYFNENISNWNVENVTDMINMFYRTGFRIAGSNINWNIKDWNVSQVKNMKGMFYSCLLYTSDAADE